MFVWFWKERIRSHIRTTKVRGFLVLLLLTLSSFFVDLSTAFADKCPDDFGGRTAKELSDCINEIRDEIRVLQQQRTTTSILAAGTINVTGGGNADITQIVGPFKAIVDLGIDSYIIRLLGPYPITKKPVVVVGPVERDTQAVLLSVQQDEFKVVTTDLMHNQIHTGFWFMVISD